MHTPEIHDNFIDGTLRKGHPLRKLSAIKAFRNAVRSCPVHEKSALGRIMYFAGLAFLEMGLDSVARRSLMAALNIGPDGLPKSLYCRIENALARTRRVCAADKDQSSRFHQYFLAVKKEHYLETKRNHRYNSKAEEDMIHDLIQEEWDSIIECRYLEGRKVFEVIRFLDVYDIVFPKNLHTINSK